MIYISGPITGIKEFKKNFQEAEDIIREKFPDEEVFNPAKVEGPETWGGYMKVDLEYLFKADRIVLLPGHVSSRGCRIELLIAEGLNLEIYYFGLDKKLRIRREMKS